MTRGSGAARRVLFVQYSNPGAYPPSEHAGEILLREGARIRYLGTGTRGRDDLRFPPHLEALTDRLGFVDPGPHQKLHYASFIARVINQSREFGADWAYVSDSLCAPVVPLLRARGVRVVYHEHDLPGEFRGGRYGDLLSTLRRLAIREADVVVCPNSSRLQLMLEDAGCATKRDAYTVWNCPMLSEIRIETTNDAPLRAQETLRLYYHGSISSDLVPVTLLYALARLPQFVTLSIVGYSTDQQHVGRLRELVDTLHLQERVFILDARSRHELMLLCSNFDVGISLFSPDRNPNHRFMTGASNKVFDYLACGLTLLVSDTEEWRQFLGELDAVRFVDAASVDGIVAAVQWFLDHPEQLAAGRAEGPSLIRESWNYEAQFAPVLRRLQDTAPPRR